jgi:hypothetical protein
MTATTWEDAMVLGGFLGATQFEAFVEDSRPKLDAAGVEILWNEYRAAKSFVKTLPPEDLANVGEMPLAKQFTFREEQIKNSPEFTESYGERPVRFASVKPNHLAVFQFQVRVGGRTLSKDPSLVLDECLPRTFTLDVDLEIIGNPSTGTFQIAAGTETGNVHLVKVRVDHERRLVELPFVPNRNWVQIAHFNKRYWIYNGYHRIYNLMALKVERIPCIIFEAQGPTEVVGNVLDIQSFEALKTMPRPPIMKDYFSKAAIKVPRRRRKSRLLATVQVGMERVPF